MKQPREQPSRLSGIRSFHASQLEAAESFMLRDRKKRKVGGNVFIDVKGNTLQENDAMFIR